MNPEKPLTSKPLTRLLAHAPCHVMDIDELRRPPGSANIGSLSSSLPCVRVQRLKATSFMPAIKLGHVPYMAVAVKNRLTPKWLALVNGTHGPKICAGDFILTHTHYVRPVGCVGNHAKAICMKTYLSNLTFELHGWMSKPQKYHARNEVISKRRTSLTTHRATVLPVQTNRQCAAVKAVSCAQI